MVGHLEVSCGCTWWHLPWARSFFALCVDTSSVTTATKSITVSPSVLELAVTIADPRRRIRDCCPILALADTSPPPGEAAQTVALPSVRLLDHPGEDQRALRCRLALGAGLGGVTNGCCCAHAPRAGMAFHNGPRLLDWANSPPHLQFNKFVLTGYRPVASGTECVRSLFYLHNELGNIYTHGIPLLGFIFLLPLSMPWSQIAVSWLGVVHYLACITPQLGSVLYHLFMNHEGGAPVYHTLLTLDMCGVCMVNTLGALPIIYVTLLCYPSTRSAALLTYTGLSSYAIYCAITARSNVTRLSSFAWQAFFRFLFFYLRWVGVGTGHPTSLRNYLVMDALALLGGMINVSRIPERWKPGKFDYWFNSHQIMHVLVVLSILYLHWGVVSDLLWITTYVCPGD